MCGLDVFLAPLLRSGGDVPRSDSGRAAAQGWSEGCTENRHSSVSYRRRAFAARNVRLEVSARAGRTTPALAPGPPSLCQRPPLLSRGGEQKSPVSRFPRKRESCPRRETLNCRFRGNDGIPLESSQADPVCDDQRQSRECLRQLGADFREAGLRHWAPKALDGQPR